MVGSLLSREFYMFFDFFNVLSVAKYDGGVAFAFC